MQRDDRQAAGNRQNQQPVEQPVPGGPESVEPVDRQHRGRVGEHPGGGGEALRAAIVAGEAQRHLIECGGSRLVAALAGPDRAGLVGETMGVNSPGDLEPADDVQFRGRGEAARFEPAHGRPEIEAAHAGARGVEGSSRVATEQVADLALGELVVRALLDETQRNHPLRHWGVAGCAREGIQVQGSVLFVAKGLSTSLHQPINIAMAQVVLYSARAAKNKPSRPDSAKKLLLRHVFISSARWTKYCPNVVPCGAKWITPCCY